MNDLIYFQYIIGFIFLIFSIVNLYIYLKMIYSKKNYIKVKGIVSYSNTIYYRYRYKTFCDYKYEYLKNTYEAYDRGYGKNLKKIGDEVEILVNKNNPKKYLPPMKYKDRSRYLIYGIIYLLLFISIYYIIFTNNN